MADERFGIQRDDGRWYAGTANFNPVFSDAPYPSGTFDTGEATAMLGQGLVKRYPDDTFKIVPTGGDDAR
ncbi:MAG TPA: hypothetical protein VNG04_05795 [Candidatus Acidoferrum sp.]|nr:hypothetical protein [Candidatus Acidoferrum sp.]